MSAAIREKVVNQCMWKQSNSPPMKVLHINVRLQEGGAARVAFDLHRKLLGEGIGSRLAYGWGNKGGASLAEPEVRGCFQAGRKIQVIGNLLINKLIGVDLFPPSGRGRADLLESMRWADVVHLHVIHSFYLPLGWLVRELVKAGKPVVWTAHDYWMLTGRCAFTEGCEGWRQGCGACPTRTNYPPVKFDFSGLIFKERRRALAALGEHLHVVAPSRFVATAIKAGFPNVSIEVVPNWLDSEFEAALQGVPYLEIPVGLGGNKTNKVIVVAYDLSDPTKVDRTLVKQILDLPNVELHTIGRNSPFTAQNVVNHGCIVDRRHMVEVLASGDVALFTSEKDTFGLVMIEALACGVPVLAVESSSSREVLEAMEFEPVKDSKQILAYVQSGSLPSCYTGVSRAACRSRVLAKYGHAASVRSYIAVYSRILSQGSYSPQNSPSRQI